MNIREWEQLRYEKMFLRAYVAGDIRKAAYAQSLMRRDRSKAKHIRSKTNDQDRTS